MSDEPTDGVMGSLPRTRPHRRSAKRGPGGQPARSPEADSQPAESTSTHKRSSATAKPAARTTAPARAKTKAKATPAAKTRANANAKATPATRAKAKATPAPKGKAKATPAPKSKANPTGGRSAAGSAGTPTRSLQSATAPRAAGDRSRKPGATSQAHHRTASRPDGPPLPRRAVPPAAEPAGAVGTAVQAAAELTEIGLKASARALRGALSRLPRP